MIRVKSDSQSVEKNLKKAHGRRDEFKIVRNDSAFVMSDIKIDQDGFHGTLEGVDSSFIETKGKFFEPKRTSFFTTLLGFGGPLNFSNVYESRMIEAHERHLLNDIYIYLDQDIPFHTDQHILYQSINKVEIFNRDGSRYIIPLGVLLVYGVFQAFDSFD